MKPAAASHPDPATGTPSPPRPRPHIGRIRPRRRSSIGAVRSPEVTARLRAAQGPAGRGR